MSTASERLQAYVDAEAKILAGQEVRFGTRMLRLADLAEVQQAITNLQRQVQAEARIAAGGSAIRYQTPDFS
ncbi:MAG: primosomal replication protein PriB/PriC domain protein [Gammaproteobacteria bacterium]